MKKLYTKPTVMLGLFWAFMLGFIFNAQATELNRPNAISVVAFAPTNGVVGNTITVVGSDLSGVTVTFSGGVVAPTISNNGFALTVQVPAGATSGPLTISRGAESVTTTTSFTLLSVPSYCVPTHTAGCVGNGVGTVRILTTPVNFTNSCASTNGPSYTVLSPSSNTTTTLTAAQSYNFEITPNGTVNSAIGFWGDWNANGTFETTEYTSFGTGNPAGTVVSRSITLPATVTAGLTAIRVRTSSGTVNNGSACTAFTSGETVDFFVTLQASAPAPSITSFTPAGGRVGDVITVNGTNLTGATFRFNGTVAVTNTNTGTQAQIVVPTGAATGRISVTTPGGTTVSNFDFTVFGATDFVMSTTPITSCEGIFYSPNAPGNYPNNTNITQVISPATAGNQVRLDFTRFVLSAFGGPNPDRLQIFNGPTAASPALHSGNGFVGSLSPFSVQASNPTGQLTLVFITDNNNNAAGFQADLSCVEVTGPGISGFSPASGAVGTTVTISGFNFTVSPGLQVRFNGTLATVTASTNTSITVTVPTGATTGPITVTNGAGTATSTAGFVVPGGAPTITSFTPNNGSIGSTVTITGTNLLPLTQARFTAAFGPGANATVVSNNGVTLVLTVPNNAATGPITVQTSTGTATSTASFTVNGTPTITTFTASAAVGATITIQGANFAPGGVEPTVLINGVEATIINFANNFIQATVPAGATTGPITITTTVGSIVSTTNIIILESPVITNFTPFNGAVGTQVTITGANLSGGTFQFNGTTATTLSNDGSTAVVTVPTGATTGFITVTSPNGSGSSNPRQFQVLVPPTITSFTPTSGPVGTTISITGTGFTGTTTFQINGVTAGGGAQTTTTARITVSAGTTTGPIRVSSANGATVTSTNFTVTGLAPTITSFTPASGPVGTTVTVNGTNYTSGTFVIYGGNPVPTTVLTANQLTFVIPTGAVSGLIFVGNANGNAFSATTFNVTGGLTPTISSFTPATGAVGEVVTINGTNFNLANTEVRFNGVLVTTLIVNSTNNIQVVVPTGATTGPITVTTPNGTGTSGTNFTVVVPPPSIIGFTPDQGGVGGTTTLFGSGFTGATSVTFNGTNALFVVNDDNTITATVPAGATSGLIRVTTPGGTSTSFGAFTITTLPVISTVNPINGIVGSTVTIGGSNLTGATAVTLNGTAVPIISNTATQIQVRIPVGATSGFFEVTTPAGTAQDFTNFFSVEVPPTITAVRPLSGNVGDIIEIDGDGLTTSDISFNGTDGVIVGITPTGIQVQVPVGATTGFITATSGVGTATSTSVFTVTNLRPNIVSISPTTGAEGTAVTISGFNLGGVTSVRFGTIDATFFPLSGNTLQAFAPAGLTGSNFIFVDGVSGRDTSTQQFTVLAPSFCGAPTITGPRLVPTTTSNSTLVTAGSAYSFKFFGSRDSVYIFSTCNSPSGEDSFLRIYNRTGTAIINQSDDGGSYCSGLSASIEFTPTASDTFIVHLSRFNCLALQTDQLLTYFRRAVTAVPVILNFEPASGLAGTLVEISGANFTGVSAVRLNGVATVFNTLGATRIQFTVPAGATSGPITVTNASGTGTSASNYTVLTATSPLVNFIAPTSGSEGTVITINGTNLGPNPTVTINGVAVTNLTVDPTNTIITATVAPGTTTGVVRVTTANGSFTTTDPFIVTRTAPVITAVTPTSGVVGATVTISGSSLLNPTSVSFNGAPATVTASSNNSITVTVPAGATSGLISVANEVGVGFSPSVFTIVLPLPTVTNFSPTSAARGTEVTINGTNLLGSSVFFGTVAATVTSNTATQIRAVVPATAVTAPITVATVAGSVTTGSDFTVILPPVIASFTPVEGVPGDTITVTGSDLTSVTNVAIGTVFATNIVSNTATSLRFIVPVGASTALIRVTTGFGSTASGEVFTVIQAPQITSFTPSSGSFGTNVNITGLNLLDAIVRFNGILVTSSTSTNNSISAQVPSGATTGFITVTNRAGTASSTTPFVINGAAPVITSFDPSQAAVGTNILVSGANFTGATNVLVGGTRVTATFSVISDNQIRFTVPTGTTDGPIIVFTPNGSDTSSTNFRVSAPLFTFPGCASTPVVNGGRIFPLQSQRTETVAPGFAYYFKFFASRDSAYMFSTCRSGLGNGNDLFLRIFRTTDLNNPVATNDDNGPVCSGFFASLEFTPTASDTFYIIASQFTCAVLTNTTLLDYQSRPTGTIPTIFLGTPTSGAIGSNVVLTGANFIGATVSINGIAQNLVGGATTNRITFTVAPGTTNGRIRVSNASGSDSTDFIFVVNAPGSPTITNFVPFTGLPGTNVTISGTNLASPTSVLFNGVPAVIVSSNANQIVAIVPGGAGVGPITVTTATGSVTTTNNFLYQFIAPTIGRFAPASGIIGTSVRVRGANLGGLTSVAFNGVAATAITNASDTAFTVEVPVGATTGAISVVTPGGTALSAAPFTVIVNTPTITSFTPASGLVGSQVTITGTNLSSASVFFGGVPATNIVSNSATSIVVVVPVNAQNGPITVTTSSGFVVSGSSFTVTIPSITFNTPTGIPTRICAGSTATVTVNVTGTPQASNVYTVQGSNGSGSFVTPFIIGSLTSSASGAISIPVTIPSTVRGTGFRYRVVSTAPAVISGDNGTNIQIDTVPNTPVVTASGSTDLCPGGTVTLTAPLATNYLWSTGATTRAITVSTAGTYTVRLINGLCTSGTSVPVIINTFPNPGQPTITASGPLTFCSGGSVTLSGPAGANGYLWSNGATTQTINVTASGSFTLRISNSNGCQSPVSAATTVTVTGSPTAPVISAGGSTTLCDGQTVTLNGPAGATSYLWINGATTRNITVSATGNYSLVVSNAAGCPSPSSNVINVSAGTTPATPTITASGPTTFCTGGSVTLNAPAGATGYLWSNGATTQSINVTASGNFTVQVSNAQGCFSLASAGTSVTVNTLPTTPTITASGSTTFCTGGSVTLTAPAGATSYLWNTGETTQSIVVSTAGNVTVRTVNASGCTSATSAATVITVNPTPTQPTVTVTGSTTFCEGGSVTLTAPAGFPTYVWSNGATTREITVSTAGNYSVSVATALGCTSVASAAVPVTVNTLPTTPTITASGPTTFCSGGSVTLSAPTATSYIWSNGATTQSIDVTASGTFTVAVTNAAGCTSAVSASRAVVVNATPAQPTVTVTGATTFCEGGSVTLTAPPSFASYIWSNGATTRAITVTTSGNYSVSVGTAAGCTSVASTATAVTVNPVPATPTISASGATTFCNGGSVTLAASSANVIWSNGATTQSIVVSTSGNFTVAALNASGCTSAVSAATSVTVNPIPAQPIITASGATTFCDGGSVTLSAPSGAANYIWSNGETTRSIVATTSGNYSVSIVSAAGCTSAVSAATAVTVNPIPAAPSVTAGGATTFCTGGSVTLTATGGTNYIWSNGATTPSITVSAAGNYSVSAISAGCTSVASAPTAVVVNALPTRPTITAGGATNFCDGGSVTLTAPTATSYIWSNGATTQSINVTASGSFTVAVTNAAGCTSQVSAATVVTVNPIPATPTISASGSTTLCAGGSVTLTASTGANYIWSNGATTSSINVNAAGNYTVRVISASGCTSAASAATAVIVNPIPATPTITASGATTFCAGGSVTLETADVAGASYLWSNGSITRSIVATAAGSYSVQVISAEGCTSLVSAATEITITAEPAAATITASGATTLCAGDSVTLTGPVTSSTYSWSNGATTQSIRVGAAGTYTLTLFNGSCAGTPASQDVIVNPRPATPVITASGPTVFCSGGDVTLTATENTDGYLWSNGATTRSITVSASADLSVVLLGANGCNSLPSEITQVRSIALPTTPTISARTATTFCEGNGVWLVGPAGLGAYSWSNGATTDSIFVTTSGTYTLQAGGGTCISAASNEIVVTVNPIPATPTITTGGATTFCAGGSVTLSAPAGAASYLWSNGATTETITVSNAGSYNAQVFGANGCPSLASNAIDVIVTPVTATPVISASGATTFCEGGSVVISAAQSAGSYLWSTGETTSSITVSSTANISLVTIDTDACTSAVSNTIAVQVNPVPTALTVTASGATTICDGSSVVLTASAGADAYLWSNGETTQIINASAAGNYSVVSISAAGCTSLGSNVVPVSVQPLTPQPTITAGGPTTLCAGETVTLTTSAADSYLWSTGETTQSITVSSTASISVVTTNTGSCESNPSATVEVNISAVPSAPVIAFTGSTGICVGETVTLVAPAGFANYLWSDGSTNDTLIAASAGDYTVQVGNNGVCLSPASAAVTITANPITPTPTITVDGDLAFCTGDSVVLTASEVADAYLWSTGATTRSITVFNAGTYSLSTTLAGACPSASSTSVDVIVNALPSTPVVTATGGTNLCPGDNVTLQAPAGFAAYLWSDGSTTESIQVSATGDYSVIVANASGCISEESNAITVGLGSPTATPTFTASGPLTFCEGTNVILTADATADAYLWSNGETTRSITVTTAGTFSLQVQNSGSCISEASSAVTTTVTPALAAPTITATGATTVCAGESVTLSAPAGFDSYLWSNGNNTQSITVNASGNYSVVVQNTGTCASLPSNEIAVLVNPISVTPTVTASGVTTFCQGGSVTLTASVTTGSYLWSNGATTQSIDVTTSGTFTVQVTDAASCISLASLPTTVVVNPIPTTPTITLTGNAGLCGTETAQLSAPAGAAAYIWSNGATTQNITVSTAATYTVQVVNAEGCTSAVSAGQTITVLPTTTTPVITASGPTSFCAGGNVTLTAPLAASYLWSTGETTRNITVNTAGNYTVQTTAAGSCISAPSVATTVVVNAIPDQPLVSVVGEVNFCQGGSVQLSAPAAAGYVWSNGATTQNITVSNSGSFSVAVISAQGCTSIVSDATVITVTATPAQPTITASGPTAICEGGSVTLTASAATGNYLWSNGSTTQSITVNAAGNFTVQVINGTCSSLVSAATAVTTSPTPSVPTVTVTGSTTLCTGDSVVLTASVSEGYLWSNGATTRSITVRAAGTFTVQATSAAGCSSAASTATSVTLNTIPARPVITPASSTSLCAGGSVILNAPTGFDTYLWSNGATTRSITVNTAGSFTVTVQNTGTCVSLPSAAVNVTVAAAIPTPTITVDGPTTFCANQDSVVLTAPAGFAVYVWSNGNTNRSITVRSVSGSYTVRVGNGTCASVASAPVVVTVNAVPGRPSINFVAGRRDSLFASVVAPSYIWTINGNVQTQTGRGIKITQNGTYAVTAVSSSGCRSIVSNGFAATSAKTAVDIVTHVYPNPFQNSLNLSMDNLLDNSVVVNIFDVVGKLVYTEVVPVTNGSVNQELNVGFLPAGSYQLQVNTSKGVIQQKLMHNK